MPPTLPRHGFGVAYMRIFFFFLFCDFNPGAAASLPCKLCQISCTSSGTTLLRSVALFPLGLYRRKAEVHLGQPGACFLLTWSPSSAQVLVQSAYFSEKDAVFWPEGTRWGCCVGTGVFQQTLAAPIAPAGMLWLQRAFTWCMSVSGTWQKHQAPALSAQAPAVPLAVLSTPIRRMHGPGLSPCLLFYCLNQLNCYPDRVSCWCKWTVLCQGICPYSWLLLLSTMRWLFMWGWIWSAACWFYQARRLFLSPSFFSIPRKQEWGVDYVTVFNLVCREVSWCLTCFMLISVFDQAAAGLFWFAGGGDVCKFIFEALSTASTASAACVAEPACTPSAAPHGSCCHPSGSRVLVGASPLFYSSQPSAPDVQRSGTFGERDSSPGLLHKQLPACRRQMCSNSCLAASSAAAEEGCSAKLWRSKKKKVHNRTTANTPSARLLWGFCQKVPIQLHLLVDTITDSQESL